MKTAKKCAIALFVSVLGATAQNMSQKAGPTSTTSTPQACVVDTTAQSLSCTTAPASSAGASSSHNLSSTGGSSSNLSPAPLTSSSASTASPQSSSVAVGQASNVTDPGLRNWVAALARSGSSVVNVVILGDSNSGCYQPACGVEGPSNASTRYTDQLRSYFVSQGISHGTGIIPLGILLSGPAINSSFWSLPGSWTQSQILGPVQTGYPYNNGGVLIQMSPGSAATLSPQVGDTLKVYCAEYTDTTSGINVAIDGVNIGTACASPTAAPAANAPTFAAAAGLGTHTAVLTSNATGHSYLYGAEWTTGQSGVSVHNLSVGGAIAEFFGSAPSSNLAFSDLIGGGTQLAILALGTNEPGQAVSPATYSATLTNLVQHEQGLGASVLIIGPPPTGTSMASQLGTYLLTASQVAAANGASYIDFSAWGTFAQANANQLFQSDLVHLNDNGHNVLFQMVAQAILGFTTSTTGSGVTTTFNGGTISNPLVINNTAGGFSTTLADASSGGVSAALFGANSCNNNHAFWLGQTGSSYIYSVPNSFVLFNCFNGQFPWLVFPSGNISISGSVYGQQSGGSLWPAPADLGTSLQVTGGLTADQFKLSSSGNRPVCNDALRGTFWFTPGPAGIADTMQVCTKTSTDSYVWTNVF